MVYLKDKQLDTVLEPGSTVSCAGNVVQIVINHELWYSASCDQKADMFNFLRLAWKAKSHSSEGELRILSFSGVELAHGRIFSTDPWIKGCQ